VGVTEVALGLKPVNLKGFFSREFVKRLEMPRDFAY